MKEPWLTELAKSINNEHTRITQYLRKGIKHARTAGDLLIQVKEKLEHGKLDAWMKANLSFSVRTAQAYMRVARNWQKLQEKSDTKAQGTADLSLEEALRLLAKPKPIVEDSNASENLTEEPPLRTTHSLSGHDPAILQPRLHIKSLEDAPYIHSYGTTAKKDDKHEIAGAIPQSQEDSMSGQEIGEFYENLAKAVHCLEALTVDASRIPKSHCLQVGSLRLAKKGIAALTKLEEIFAARQYPMPVHKPLAAWQLRERLSGTAKASIFT